jgi:hypothetical protein
MRRSCSGQALSRLERSRIWSGVASPGLPRSALAAATEDPEAASSGEISSMVDLKRTASGD